ncbi:glycosyltransferase 87 family protein [Streptomyces sp. NPDC005805]|uniref:glycosyltransferase 87 family protein n=1 Tax=Streptomyces sp. NPDC005805 TaxID=3157068 RepID=UPI0033F3F05F
MQAAAGTLHLLMLALLHRPERGTLRDHVLAWDARHFLTIATDGYPDGFTYTPEGELTGNELAFFPLYPLTVRAVGAATGTEPETAALIATQLAFCAALFAVHRLVLSLHGPRTALIAIVLLAVAQPMGVVFLMGYSEALLLALAAGALLACRREAWLTAGAAACLAGLTRPTAAAVTLAVAVAAVQAVVRERRVGWRPVAGVALAGVGIPAYVLWVGDRLGRWDGWFRVQEAGWGTHWDTGAEFAGFLPGALARETDWVPVSTAVLVLVLILLTVAAWRTPGWLPLLVYGTGVVVIALGQSNYYHCKLRMLVPAVIFLLPPARALAAAHPRTAGVCLAGAGVFGAWYGASMLTVWPYAI